MNIIDQMIAELAAMAAERARCGNDEGASQAADEAQSLIRLKNRIALASRQ